MLDYLNDNCCRSCHVGDNGPSAESNQPHKPTEDIQPSTHTHSNTDPLTTSPVKNLLPNPNSNKFSNMR